MLSHRLSDPCLPWLQQKSSEEESNTILCYKFMVSDELRTDNDLCLLNGPQLNQSMHKMTLFLLCVFELRRSSIFCASVQSNQVLAVRIKTGFYFSIIKCLRKQPDQLVQIRMSL